MMLVATIVPNVDFAADSAREVIHRSVTEYVKLVEQHPNVLRLILQARFSEPRESTTSTLNEGREITMAIAQMFNNELREVHLDPVAVELAAIAAFGSAAAATDWWLGPDPDGPRRMPAGEFVAHLSTIMLGTVNSTADLLGVDLDPDLPIRRATSRSAIAG